MPSNRTKKFILSCLILAQVFALPSLALAQVGDVPTSNTALGTGGIVGAGLGATANGIIAGISTTNTTTCTTPEKAFFASDKGISIGMGGLALISGGASLQAQIIKKIGQLEIFKTCHQAQLEAAKAVTAPNTFSAQNKQILIDEITKQIANLADKEEPLNQQLKVAQDGFWKTLVFNILIKTTKTIAINLVNKLNKDFHITDFSKYADAVATQVYDSEFILDNFSGAKADQMLVRSLVANPALQAQMSPAVLQYSNNALGFDPKTLDVSDPNFYQKMYSVGGGQANPFVQQIAFANAAQMIHAKSLVTAQSEIAQSAGLKTPRNCQGTMAQQQSIDQSYRAADAELDNRWSLYNSLVSAQKANYPVSEADLTKAQNDLAKAQKQLDDLPNSVASPIVTICAAIVSPPALISKGIDEAFSSLTKNMGTYNTNNMPFFINFISDVANEVSNDLIFAGNVNTSNLLNENIGNLARATSLVTSAAQANVEVKQNKNLVVTTSLNSISSDGKSAIYNIAWDAQSVGTTSANGSTQAQAVSVSGPNLPATINGVMVYSLTGTTSVTVPTGSSYNYTVTVYGKSKADVLTSVTAAVDATQAKISQATLIEVDPGVSTLSFKAGGAPAHFAVTAQDGSGNAINVLDPAAGTLTAVAAGQTPQTTTGDTIPNVINVSLLNDQVYVTPVSIGTARVHIVYTNSSGKSGSVDVPVTVTAAGTVSGAFISKQPLGVRGPVDVVRPRGE